MHGRRSDGDEHSRRHEHEIFHRLHAIHTVKTQVSLVLVPKDTSALKIHARPLQNSLTPAEPAGGPRARARCIVTISTHGATHADKTATGARQPLPSMMKARARACSDHGCLRMTARTRKRSSTQNGQWQSRAHARHGMLSCAQSMHDPQHAQTLKLPARTQD